jgi:Fibronectin type III domain
MCALVMPILAATDASAATQVTVTNTGKLNAVGPVNTVHGFPSWYQDSNNTRIEPCLDQDNPMCGFLPGDVPAAGPITFPTNFPEEFFYQLVDSTLTLPAGGKAVLTLGLEGAFANGGAVAGDQQVFARTRIVVKGAPANTTLTFTHPFGAATVDTDGTGAGKLVEDKTPAVGNFGLALQGNFGPFLTWDTGPVKDSTGEYAGDPAVDHAVKGGLNNNTFTVTGGGLNLSTNLFAVSGKIAINTGVQATGATPSANGQFVDVFATSTGEQLQVEATATSAKTPMVHDANSDRFYARVPVTGAVPANLTVTNIGDKPVSTSSVDVKAASGITISSAEFDGAASKLTVKAISSVATDTLTLTGYGDLVGGTGTFTTLAPPASVEVKSGTRTATAPVVVTTGGATVAQPPLNPQNPTGPVVTAPGVPVNLAATAGATNVVLTWAAATTGGTPTSYQVAVYNAAGTALVTTPAQPVSTTTTSQNIVGLAPNTTYRFTVKAINSAGASAQTGQLQKATATETLAVTTARWKATDFRVVGTSSATSGTVSVYSVNPATVGATPIAGMTNVPLTSAAPTPGSNFDARLRTGVPPRPASVWVKSATGAVIGPITVT